MKLIVPELSTLSSWLEGLDIESYQCGYCDALHLTYLRHKEGIFDAKVDLIENVICFSIISEIKPSAIMSLMVELSQINASSNFVKIYMDVPDDAYPKLIFRHVLDCSKGVTESQFSAFFLATSNEVLQIIEELNSHEVLLTQDDPEDYDDLTYGLPNGKQTTYH